MAAEDVSGYDAHKGLAQSAFSAVANMLGVNTPAAAVTAPGQDAAATTPAATETAPAAESRTDQAAPATPQARLEAGYDPAAESMKMFMQQQRNTAMMGGGGGDLLGNGGNAKAQVFGPQAPGKQQPSLPGPGGRGRA